MVLLTKTVLCPKDAVMNVEGGGEISPKAATAAQAAVMRSYCDCLVGRVLPDEAQFTDFLYNLGKILAEGLAARRDPEVLALTERLLHELSDRRSHQPEPSDLLQVAARRA
jgi:hypothetical protein